MSTNENKVFKRDGELVVKFTFKTGGSLLEMEQQIASLLEGADASVSELERQAIRAQLLAAIREQRDQD